MGKRKIAIEKIDDKKKMNVTFSKRRKGLFGKALNNGGLCNANIAVVVFSPTGKPYTCVTPNSSVDAVIDQYLNNMHSKEITEVEGEEEKERDQLNQCTCEGKQVDFWSNLIDADKDSSLEELQLLRRSLESLRENVYHKLDDAHAEQLQGVEDERRDNSTSDLVADLSSYSLYSADESGGVEASDSITDLSFCPFFSTDEDDGTVFATIDDESYADWIVADDHEDCFDHKLDDAHAEQLQGVEDESRDNSASDLLADLSSYSLYSADESGSVVASDSITDLSYCPFSSTDEGDGTVFATIDEESYVDWIVADDREDCFDQIFFDNSGGATTY